MVNNAGIGGTENHGMVHEMTEDTWDTKYACAQSNNQMCECAHTTVRELGESSFLTCGSAEIQLSSAT